MRLKFITLNFYQGILLDQTIAFLQAQQPDVVVLQEVYDAHEADLPAMYRSLDTLRERLTFLPHIEYEPSLAEHLEGDLEGHLVPWGNAILSRFPVVDRDAVFFNGPFVADYYNDIKNNPTMPHTILHAALDTPAGTVHIFDVHGPWDLDGDNPSEMRRQMAQAIVDGTKGKSKVIVAGDTNAKPTNKAMSIIEPQLTSVFGTSLPSSFNMRHKTNPGYATATVDMVYVSPDVTVIEKECSEADVSDHKPLIVTLEIPNDKQDKDVQ